MGIKDSLRPPCSYRELRAARLLNYLYYNNLNVKWQFLFYVRLGAGEVGGRNFNFLTLVMRKQVFSGLLPRRRKKVISLFSLLHLATKNRDAL